MRKGRQVRTRSAPPVHILVTFALLNTCVLNVKSQSPTFAGNAQHQAQFAAPAQDLNHLRWSKALALGNNYQYHFGAPVITVSNTVIFANLSGIFALTAIEGATGRVKYTRLFYFYGGKTIGPVITAGPAGSRLYYPGPGGTVYYIDNPDSDNPAQPSPQICFYMPIAAYRTNESAYDSAVYIDTPLTADTNGAIFFGFSAGAPIPGAPTNSGYARIETNGVGSYVTVPSAAGDPLAVITPDNYAPALSSDGATLYVVASQTNGTGYLLGLDSTTLQTKYKVALKDPRNGNSVGASNGETSSPTIGPDGDVYFGVYANPNNEMGWTLHYSADLATQKLPSLFGWDFTPAIVPTNIVQGYHGPSSYLLVSKYNFYFSSFYRVAILDPNVAQQSNLGISMREVLTVRGPTSSREWCINTPAVNAATASVLVPNEDGKLYRWNLLSNSLSEAFSLNGGFGEAYVPTVVGPDGASYTISGGRLYAIDSLTNLAVSSYSSAPDERKAILGQQITFTAMVTNPTGTGPVPSGTVSFFDGSNSIALNISLANGTAQAATSNLTAGAHAVSITYSGDQFYPTGMVTLVQRIHARTSTMLLTSTVPVMGSNSVTFYAALSSPQGGTPTGMVTFWDADSLLGQTALALGIASLASTNMVAASHRVWAEYSSDATYTSCTGAVAYQPATITELQVGSDGSFHLAFTNASGAPISVLGSGDLSIASSNWTVLGQAIEIVPGQFEFVDPLAANRANYYYQVRSP